MSLQDKICSRLKDHAALVNAGIESKQALDIITYPIQTEYLEECLNRLSIDQLDELIKVLSDNLYTIDGKKAIYMMCGVIKETVGYRVCFTDCALQIDSFEVLLNDLTNKQQEDILTAIKQII